MGIDSSCVIVEDTGRIKKKNKKKQKRILQRSEVVQTEDELKRKAEAMLVKEQEEKAETHDGRGRQSLGIRLRQKFHDTFYSDKKES